MTKSQIMAFVPIVFAVVIMLGTGVVQGVWSERWGEFPELKAFADQLSKIPKQVGEWEGVDAPKTDDKLLKIAGAEGELVRVYRNAQGEEVQVSIICARMRDIFAHTPDRCYPAAGFEMQGEPQHVEYEIGRSTAAFFTTSFLKVEPTGTQHIRGYWSWTGDGTWVAPKNEKLVLAKQQRALYKMYIFANVPAGNKQRKADRDYGRDFIDAFIPALDTALRPVMEEYGRIKPPAEAESTDGAKEQPAEAAKAGV